MINVIYLLPQCEPREILISSGPNKETYNSLKTLVGGILDVIYLGDGLDGFINDEGLLMGLPPNVYTETGALLVGPIVFTRTDDEGETVSVKPQDLQTVKDWLAGCQRPGRFDYGY
jgi:hypothetical protein